MPGSTNCRYSCGEPLMAPAEDVDEQQQEHDRLDGEVGQLERVVLELH